MKTIEEAFILYLLSHPTDFVVDYYNYYYYSYDTDTNIFVYKPIDDPDGPWLYHPTLNKVYIHLTMYGSDNSLRS